MPELAALSKSKEIMFVDSGNYLAVGSMQPKIEIWDLDVWDEVEPVVVLGGREKDVRAGKKRKKKNSEFKKGRHTDFILGLAWNNEFQLWSDLILVPVSDGYSKLSLITMLYVIHGIISHTLCTMLEVPDEVLCKRELQMWLDFAQQDYEKGINVGCDLLTLDGVVSPCFLLHCAD